MVDEKVVVKRREGNDISSTLKIVAPKKIEAVLLAAGCHGHSEKPVVEVTLNSIGHCDSVYKGVIYSDSYSIQVLEVHEGVFKKGRINFGMPNFQGPIDYEVED